MASSPSWQISKYHVRQLQLFFMTINHFHVYKPSILSFPWLPIGWCLQFDGLFTSLMYIDWHWILLIEWIVSLSQLLTFWICSVCAAPWVDFFSTSGTSSIFFFLVPLTHPPPPSSFSIITIVIKMHITTEKNKISPITKLTGIHSYADMHMHSLSVCKTIFQLLVGKWKY